MSRLTHASVELHRRWIVEAGAEDLQNAAGGLKLYRDRETFRRDALERELLQRCAVKHRVLDAEQAYDLEPDLKRIFNCAVLIEESLSIRNPEKLCKHYARLFEAAGGEIVQSTVRELRESADGWELTGDGAPHSAPLLVLCLGAWTPALIGQLGYRNPLAIERGYHTVFAAAHDSALSRPIFDVDASYVMAPMEAGLRVTSGSNLVHRETRPDPRQLARVAVRAREAFPLGEELLGEPWMGRRPTVPDTLPLIGAAPRHRKLWLAFGHSHMGLTLGPITGRLIANAISGAEQPFSLAPCDPARYL